MNALYYIVDTLTSLYLGVLILRLIMQMVRANFRNPFAEAILRLTNPLIMPLRRVLPPMGKIDTATVLAIILFAIFKVAVLMLRDRRQHPVRAHRAGCSSCCARSCSRCCGCTSS